MSGAELLRVWEAGLSQHPLDRALTLLGAAYPGATRGELAELDVGERDAWLFRLRAETFGALLAAFAVCRACGEPLEFTLETGELARVLPEVPREWEFECEGSQLRFRLPNSWDLAAARSAGTVEGARRALAARCVRGGAGEEVALSEATLSAVTARMAELAPAAEVRLQLHCPACGEPSALLLDIGEFYWAELDVYARRLIREVHALATAYGWSEAEILSLTPHRRQSYLEMI